MPRVLNKYHITTPSDNQAYIGRPSIFGNPFTINVHGNREEVIEQYKKWIVDQPEIIKAAKEQLRGKDLVCFCAPKSCHGDVLIKIANED